MEKSTVRGWATTKAKGTVPIKRVTCWENLKMDQDAEDFFYIVRDGGEFPDEINKSDETTE